MGALEERLRAVRAGGDKAFVPYVTGGLPGVDAALLRGLQGSGADAIEVGIPHSDPIMDGGVIQEASRIALEHGTRLGGVLATIREAALTIPVAIMTYANPVYRHGLEAFCDDVAGAGVVGAIVPDLPVDEAAGLAGLASARGIDLVLLAAPGTTPARYAAIGAASRGFVYCVATYGVTGARTELSATAREVVDAMRPHTDLPLLVGVGIATPEHAAAACAFADGAIVGSAIVAALTGEGPDAALGLASRFRGAIRP
ncbi:MAG: tryptophan synthase subunit alpha [Planctomycetaceae bacterium]